MPLNSDYYMERPRTEEVLEISHGGRRLHVLHEPARGEAGGEPFVLSFVLVDEGFPLLDVRPQVVSMPFTPGQARRLIEALQDRIDAYEGDTVDA